MIIDSHVHLRHGNQERTEYAPEAIVRVMDEAGVEKSVVFAMCTTTVDANKRALDAAARFPDRLIGYAYALPSMERVVLDDLKDGVENGLKGIKIHRGECSFAEYVIDPVLDLAAELQVPCLIDFGGRDADLKRMALSFPNTTIIACHIGQFRSDRAELLDRFIAIAETHENVYLDVSGVILTHKIADAAKRVGAHRVIWGSDGPSPEPGLVEYVREDIRKVRSSGGLTDAESQMVLGGNIARLLGISS